MVDRSIETVYETEASFVAKRCQFIRLSSLSLLSLQIGSDRSTLRIFERFFA